MQKLHPSEVNIPTYHFRVKKIVGISTSKVMFREHFRRRNGEVHIHYYGPWWVLSNSFFSDLNKYHMQKLLPSEVDVPTNHFWVCKPISISYYKVMFRETFSKMPGVFPFPFCATR